MKHIIRAVLFDLDGVVVFTDKYHYLGWKKLADEQGWQFDEEVNNQCRGVPRMASLQVILDHNNVELPDDEKQALATRKNEYYKELLEGINESDLYPGVIPFLEQLKAEGVRLGLCSSSKNAATVLEKLNLTPFFEAVVTGRDITHAKPDPEIFLLGAEQLGIHPFHCLVFEDAPSGVAAGLAAGMKVIGVGTPDVLANAPETITDYGEIDVTALLDCGRPKTVSPEPWTVAETAFNPNRAQYWETLFALTNGFMGLRGTYEEDDPKLSGHAYPGFFLNGIYDYEPFHHVISFPGFPKQWHAMLNLCDWRIINLTVDGERFSMFDGRTSAYRRELDLKRGVAVRSLEWESPGGKRVRIRTTRVVSMARRHAAAIRYEVTPLNFSGSVEFESVTRPVVPSAELAGDRFDITERGTRGQAHYFVGRPKTAEFRVGMAITHRLDDGAHVKTEPGDDRYVERFRFNASRDRAVVLEKHACFHTSIETPADDVLEEALGGVETASELGFDALLAEHVAFWEAYWERADIEIDGPVADQQALRLSMFHLRQSNPEDDQRSISACGMTGDHYRGHVFWDTEMYIAPHFLYTEPEIVRPLLMYRYHLLDRARDRAREMAGKGALFSWNSISGEECGIVYEASTAEYHLVSAIALAIGRYVRATDDTAFLYDHGAEILFETSRFLADRGAFIDARDGKFCINVVCGPDEYGCGINNNCYTNMLARWHFRYAVEVHRHMSQSCPDKLATLSQKIGLSPDEPVLWRRCADQMYIPYDEERGIHAQDDSFLYLDPVDMSRLPMHVDLRNLNHPLNLWRMQVAKQADVVLLMFVLSDQFPHEQKRANYEYYEPRTNHGSSLSTSIHSIMASEVGRLDDAYQYFRHSALMDLNDFKNNTAGGMHAACLGGTWMAVINGFAGIRDEPDGLRFDPCLPPAWNGYRFKLRYRGRSLEVSVEGNKATLRLLSGPGLRAKSASRSVELSPESPSADSPVRRMV